jgi:predicted secreted Zn-dependent protease
VYRVQWNDFQGSPPAGSSLDAHIETKADLNYQYSSGSGGTRLADSVTVTIRMLRGSSWARKQRINSWSQAARDALLKHEQGHYDLTALMGRDMFIDLMALKPQSFANVGALQTAVTTIAQRYDPQRIHTKYDSTQESDHGRNPTQQRAWDGYIQTAFTQARSPAVSAPDGAAYKIRLLDVLRNAGKI